MIRLHYRTMLRLQKCLYINIYLSLIWGVVVAFFLYVKIEALGHLTKYLSVTVYTLLVVVESVRLYLGHYGNLASSVPELAGFLMLTVLMQMPLVSFFLFNPYLLSTPTEVTLHTLLWAISISEIVFGFLALRRASNFAKTVYLSN
ncbi:transmembrane protein 17B [Pectinophora gossypiella]|uniref:transmembrane protein 17B n=1 Tax=Pectinophora gossypiella TaxID=13191 RepID=UPI00214E0F8D|nr:transmembrane protein 17B [Pectinophora gossypiella]